MKRHKTFSASVIAIAIALVVFMTPDSVRAHEVTYRGTVLTVEATKLQVKTVDETTKKEASEWFNVGKATKTRRGDKLVPYADAKIMSGERIVLIVDHDAATKMLATDIRLAAK